MKANQLAILIFLIGIMTQVTTCLHLSDSVIGNTDNFLQDSYNYFVTKNGNIVWAGALSLAWHELTDNIIKEDVRLNSDDKIVSKIVSNFNTCPFQRKDLAESSYYIKSGYGQKTVTEINSEVKKKFPKRSFPDIDATLGDKDIISYAYLVKTFEYPIKFEVKDNFLFKQSSVKGFWASNKQQRDQVKYFYYKNKNDFLVKLQTKDRDEGVYLLRTQSRDDSVADIINQVKNWENQPLQSLQSIDSFQMPKIDFDYEREVSQIQNIALLNNNFKIDKNDEYRFTTVYEGIKLKIDEAGGKVQNQGVIMMRVGASPVENPVQPKQFVLNDTFWVILKEQGKHPYLCIKVNNPKEKQSL